jgi:hypothetical protein
MDPYLLLPVHSFHFLVAGTSFPEHSTVAEPPGAISSPVDVDSFRVFADTFSEAPPVITNVSSLDLLMFAAEVGFVRLPHPPTQQRSTMIVCLSVGNLKSCTSS